MGQVSYVRQVFIDAQWYADAQKAYEANPKGSQRPAYDHTDAVISHALANKELVLWPGNADVDIMRALRLAPTIGARWALTGAQEGYAVANEIAAAKVPVFINVNWPVAGQGGGGGGRGGGDTGDTLRTLRFRDRAPSTPAKLNAAGVKFAFASEGIANPKDILKNVAKSFTAGLPADIALKALTLGAAEILGVSDRIGSIEPGKIANLVVTDGDIFSDKTNVKWIFVDGKLYAPPPVVETPQGGRGGGAAGGDISGTWTLTYSVQGATQESTAALTMAADGSISGSISSQMGTVPITRGHLNGNQFSISISVPMNGDTMDITMTGTMNGNSLSGSMSVAGQMLDFTGRRPGATADESGGDVESHNEVRK
jgi:hypothetical protein